MEEHCDCAIAGAITSDRSLHATGEDSGYGLTQDGTGREIHADRRQDLRIGQSGAGAITDRSGALICPLLSGPASVLDLTMKEECHVEEAQA